MFLHSSPSAAVKPAGMSDYPIIRIRHAEDDFPLSTHTHPACELIFIKRGSVRVQVNRKRYEAGAGSLVLIGALEQHELEITGRPYERYFCIFSPQLLEQPGRSPLLAAAFKNRPHHFSHCISLSRPEESEWLLQIMAEEFRSEKPFSEELIANLLEQLLILVYREHAELFSLPQTERAGKVWEVQRYLETHYAEPVSIAELAASRFINPDYLGRSFKELTGYTPKQYLLEYRLLHSRQLLLDGLPVGAAAYRCGFRDVNNFIRAFKNRYGITPKHFQKIGQSPTSNHTGFQSYL